MVSREKELLFQMNLSENVRLREMQDMNPDQQLFIPTPLGLPHEDFNGCVLGWGFGFFDGFDPCEHAHIWITPDGKDKPVQVRTYSRELIQKMQVLAKQPHGVRARASGHWSELRSLDGKNSMEFILASESDPSNLELIGEAAAHG